MTLPDMIFGTFVTPSATDIPHVLELVETADRTGLDLVTFQDHPYQPAFLDTSTLLAFAAARTERVHLAANVANLPLRPPAVLARSAASLDLLSGGRFELGIGSGAFWDAIEAMGGRRLSPGQAVDALREAIGIIREVWDTETRGGVRTEGTYYRTSGMKRGPRPAHDIGIWVGAYKPRMLALTGELGDGWLPSWDYLPDGFTSFAQMSARIDDAALEAGRRPEHVRRLLNIMRAEFGSSSSGFLTGTPRDWVGQLVEAAHGHALGGIIIGGDDVTFTERFAAEVAPAVREALASKR